MLRLTGIDKGFEDNFGRRKEIFTGFNLHIKKGEFVSIVGSNGAGKSTLMNLILGNEISESGDIYLHGKNITFQKNHKRAGNISQVYQNPTHGVASNMTIYENLSMGDNKGRFYDLTFGLNKKRRDYYKKLLKSLDLGLEKCMDQEVGLLSGGQRQCLSLLMATLSTPKLLLLDEHTAALDPKTSKIILDKTKELIETNNLTALMITHDIQDAIDYGNRLIMLSEGKIILDISGDKKSKLTVEEILNIFNRRKI